MRSRAPVATIRARGPHGDVAPAAHDAHHPVGEHRHGRGVEPDLDRGQSPDLRGQDGADLEAAGPGMGVFDRAEELVGLQHELAAQPVLVVDEQGADAEFPQLDGGREPRRPAADDQDIGRDGCDRRGRGRRVRGRQPRQAFDRRDAHPGAQGGHAGLDRPPVGDDQTLRALAVGAEEALGAPVLGVVAEHLYPGCDQRRGEHLVFEAGEGRPVPGERHRAPVRHREDGVGVDSAGGHGRLLRRGAAGPAPGADSADSSASRCCMNRLNRSTCAWASWRASATEPRATAATSSQRSR